MQYKRVALLAGEWDTTPVVYHFLKGTTGVVEAIVEKPVARKEFLKKRIKKLGLFTVGGQVLFQLLVAKTLAKTSRKRINDIISHYGLTTGPIPQESFFPVPSINSDACLERLKALQPDLIIVHGTRIISKKVLQAISCPFINIHAGITPRYRGSHGAYWALANEDKEHCGVTVHLVDAGIDTGNILAQKNIPVTRDDNFTTYPYLQLAEGLMLLKEVLHTAQQKGDFDRVKNNLDSALWHHPTLWGYWYNRITKGVK